MTIAYIRKYKEDGDVEIFVMYARKYLQRAGLSSKKKIEIEEELTSLLLEGYEAEAWKNLDEARTASTATDVSHLIEKMRCFLKKVETEEAAWLKENDSSIEEIDSILKKGGENRKENLRRARIKVIVR